MYACTSMTHKLIVQHFWYNNRRSFLLYSRLAALHAIGFACGALCIAAEQPVKVQWQDNTLLSDTHALTSDYLAHQRKQNPNCGTMSS